MVDFIGYHGTTAKDAGLLEASGGFLRSSRDGLWLGTGAYFFQDGYGHALSWAQRRAQEYGGDPVVIEARIAARVAVDFSDRKHWQAVLSSYDLLAGNGTLRAQLGPEGLFSDEGRNRPTFGHNAVDHDVINHFIATYNDILGEAGEQIDVIRCPFPAGRQVYPTSWFFGRSCIMISVVNLSTIKSWSIV